ncbi:MAG: PorT family protein [Saprospiraceae bacterium]|nr:PorT family protein [Saprospiraceae bacterium]
MKKRILVLALAMWSCQWMVAQDLSYGFRAGINRYIQDGPLEEGETVDYNSGFHIGFGFGMWFTDIWGVRAELMYNQKGVKYAYNGPSYVFLQDQNENPLTFTGTRDMTLNVSSSYIDVPIMVFARATSWLELSAGVAPGFLIYSSGTGEMTFNSSRLDSYTQELDYSYYGDKLGEADFSDPIQVENKNTGNFVDVPSSAGAYYYQKEKDGSYYKVFDLGAVAGLSFYLNRGLYLGARYHFGLIDITNNKNDYSVVTLENGSQVLRDDKDTNKGWQISVGFNF